ncbi:RIP metalloprotease RseP [Roseomonas sp. BN140053]|uniref:RIP metalloprotease RseP n=1 Tax=Roseomonas sp. BN140053 TaxID=3391898 RepID=UPI0039E817FA
MDALLASLRTPVAFLVVLGVLVFVHEAGHYLAARWRGVHVERFAIGFGRPLARWTDRRDTKWQIGWLPLGGYVKLHGQEQPGDVDPEIRATWKPGQTFHDKPVLDRALVVAAGPAANFLLAILFFAVLFVAVGRPVATATVGSVVAGSAAERAGVLAGDQITGLDGQAIGRFEEVQRYIQPRAGVPVQMQLRREGRELSLPITPDSRARGEGTPPVGVLGIAGGAPVFERVDPFTAVVAGVTHTADISWQTLAGVWQMITGQRGTEELGGPLRIAQLSGQVAELGIASLITFMAVLSINLGLINLFPIPVLDGGHLLFYAAEAIRGRPLPPRFLDYGLRAGLAVLAALFLFSTWNDLSQLGVVRWITGAGG